MTAAAMAEVIPILLLSLLAFAAGLLTRMIEVSGREPNREYLVKLEGIGFGFLVPVFFISSSHAAWAVLGGCGVAALALGVISTSSWAKAAAARNGQRLATAPIPESQGHPVSG